MRGITGSGKMYNARLLIDQLLHLSLHTKREHKVSSQIKALHSFSTHLATLKHFSTRTHHARAIGSSYTLMSAAVSRVPKCSHLRSTSLVLLGSPTKSTCFISFISSWLPALRHRSKITLRLRIRPTMRCSHRQGMLTCFHPSGHLLFQFQALQVTFTFLASVNILTCDFSCFRVITTALCVPAYSRPIRMVTWATYATYAPVLWPIGELGGFALLWGYVDIFYCLCSRFRADSRAVCACACTRCIRVVPGPLWLLWLLWV